MAKAKKQKKSIEQRLEEALVLYEKTPYELPKNWCWTRVENCFSMKNGYAFRQSDFNKNGKTPVIKIRNLQDGEIVVDDKTDYVLDNFSSEFTISSGDLLVALSGATTGKFGIYKLKEKAYLNQRVGNIGINSNCIVEKYRNYFFEKSSEEILKSAYGGAQPNISWNDIKLFFFPLAPLEEQKRIVEIIEKQFAKLDEARDLIQKSLDSFADRKSAILHKAFTGELTKQWRENNSVIQQKNTVNFLDCIEDMQNGISKRNGKEGKDFVVLRLADLKENRISTDDNRTIKLTETEIRKYQLKENDVIMIRVNGSKDYVGRQILFNKECNCAYCDHIIRIRYRKDINAKFMLYFSQTREYKDYILQNLVSSAGQNTISRKGLSRLKVNLPILAEQKEIVRILDSIFEKEDKSKELIDMLDKIDEMKKSILARAFRGQLGTSNPTDESAIELLKKILDNDKDESNQRKRVSKTSISFDYSLLKNNVEVGVIKEIVKKGGKVTTDYFNKNHMGLSIFEIVKVVDLLIKRNILKTEEGWLILNTNED